jgi:hypothetical protein
VVAENGTETAATAAAVSATILRMPPNRDNRLLATFASKKKTDGIADGIWVTMCDRRREILQDLATIRDSMLITGGVLGRLCSLNVMIPGLALRVLYMIWLV